jgi:hypothetical protein
MGKLPTAAVLISVLALAACGDDGDGKVSDRGLPQGSEPSNIKPADFSTTIDNPYLPMRPGDRWVYAETDSEGGRSRVVVTVTDRTRKIANGVTARVVREVVSEDGAAVEITDDWFAQDQDGNVWFFGNAARNYEDGKLVSRDRFEAGKDGAEAGVAMAADPVPGLTFRNEYFKGEAEDRSEIVTVGKERADTPAGFFENLVMARETAPPEPKLQEFKFYARDVGIVLTVNTDRPGSRGELVQYTPAKQ